MKQLTITLFTLCVTIAQAQDFIVTTRQDTIRGRVRVTSYATTDKVHVTEQDKKKTEFAVTAVLAVFSNSQQFRPVLTSGGYRLLKVEKPGLLSLYMAQQTPGMPYNIPYLVKSSGEALEVPNLKFKKTVTDFLIDCKSIQAKIEEEDWGKKNLDQIIEAYNLCIDAQTKNSFIPSSDPTITALTELKNKLEKDPTVHSDAMDIMKDIYSMVYAGKIVPNYVRESLRASLKSFPQYNETVDAALNSLKN